MDGFTDLKRITVLDILTRYLGSDLVAKEQAAGILKWSVLQEVKKASKRYYRVPHRHIRELLMSFYFAKQEVNLKENKNPPTKKKMQNTAITTYRCFTSLTLKLELDSETLVRRHEKFLQHLFASSSEVSEWRFLQLVTDCVELGLKDPAVKLQLSDFIVREIKEHVFMTRIIECQKTIRDNVTASFFQRLTQPADLEAKLSDRGESSKSNDERKGKGKGEGKGKGNLQSKAKQYYRPECEVEDLIKSMEAKEMVLQKVNWPTKGDFYVPQLWYTSESFCAVFFPEKKNAKICKRAPTLKPPGKQLVNHQ